VLLDIERIAPCMPGAQLTEVEGNEYRGIVKVKVGPITAQYKGAARIVEADQGAGRVVIKAEGRDTRGQGNASATVTATLVGDGDFTQVSIDTDLNVTGKVAQFGRGVMADVSSKLLGQFAACLQEKHLSGASEEVPAEEASTATDAAAEAAPEPAAASEPTTGVRTINSPEAEPVDLLGASSDALIKRIVPIVAALVALLAVRSIFKRGKKRRHRKHHDS
jgi:carbon monoxide dehydrogenase subunit G